MTVSIGDIETMLAKAHGSTGCYIKLIKVSQLVWESICREARIPTIPDNVQAFMALDGIRVELDASLTGDSVAVITGNKSSCDCQRRYKEVFGDNC